MKHMQEIEVPARKEIRVVRVTCELCGIEIKKEPYSAEEIVVKHRTGSGYPECGSGEEVEVDICGVCFDTKLIPWLKSQGAEPQTREWDW